MKSGKLEKTRNGDAIVAPNPVTIRYDHPKEHVLLNTVRDANPFFHLMEAMWMLAGREDGQFLDPYIKNFSKTYGDPTGRIPDAYGFRWRKQLAFDQLHVIICQLKENPATRQAVLQMWDDDLTAKYQKPCNLVATFRINRDNKLDMTVFNRSNDLIWGACGANAVHFPIMQEYVASMTGLEMGKYWQVSANLHLYTEHQIKLTERADNYGIPLNERLGSVLRTEGTYGLTSPLVTYPESFDEEVHEIIEMIIDINKDLEIFDDNLSQLFLRDTVLPMARAHRHYKNRAMAEALVEIENVVAEDWKIAGREWIKRRTSIRVGEEEYGQQA